MVIDKDPQILLYFLVDPLRLHIGLGMVGSGGIPFDVQQFVQVLHEVRVELGAPVMDDFLGDAMKFEYMIAIQPGHAFRSDGGVGGQDVNLLGKAVHHHADGIVPLGLWQFSNQVDADDLPGLSGDVVRVEWVVRALPDVFDPLALSTLMRCMTVGLWPSGIFLFYYSVHLLLIL